MVHSASMLLYSTLFEPLQVAYSEPTAMHRIVIVALWVAVGWFVQAALAAL